MLTINSKGTLIPILCMANMNVTYLDLLVHILKSTLISLKYCKWLLKVSCGHDGLSPIIWGLGGWGVSLCDHLIESLI